MTKKIGKSIRILGTLMMIVGLFMIVPLTANASTLEADSAEPTFYVVGSFTGWTTNDAYILTKNAEAEGEYVLSGVELSKDDELKIVDADMEWYPNGMNDNYVVPADGIYDIYFRPNYDGGSDWHYLCIYLADVTPEPSTYTVIWQNWDDTVLATDTDVEEGTIPKYEGATPIKIQDDEYAYTFSGWTDGINTYEPNNTLPAVKSDVTYTAVFVSGIKSIVNDKYYYVDDQLVKGFGMIKYQGDYYYVKKNGAVLRDMLLNVTADKTNGLVPAGKYKFDADGKMVVKDGIIVGDCYYADGKLAKGAGLVKVDGDYYYVRANGAIYKNVSLNVTEEKTNGLVVAGKYKFDADGKMVINGIVDGYYYADGKPAKGVGLIEVDGAYYYIKANGAVYKNASLNVTEDKANDLVPAGKYFFDSEGKMIIA